MHGKISCWIDWRQPLLYFKLRYQALQEKANPICMARHLAGQIGDSHYCTVSLDIRLYRRQPILYGKISCQIDWRQPLLYCKLRYQALQQTANPICMARYLAGQIGDSHYCTVTLDIRLYRRQPILYGKISCRIDWRQPLLYCKLRYQASQKTANPIQQDILPDRLETATIVL